MSVAEIGGPLVETALTFAPWLIDVPVLGRICLILSPGGGNDLKALEQLQAQAEQTRTKTRTAIKENARYVLKASDAMKCVQDTLADGGVMLALGKAILNSLANKGGATAPDILTEKIFLCIESKILSQKSKRVKFTGSFYHRPSLGHGRGRSSFGPSDSSIPTAPALEIGPEEQRGTE
jgi:hypothetical protein